MSKIRRARRIRKAVFIIGLLSAVVGIFTFATGIVSFSDLVLRVRTRWAIIRAGSQPQPKAKPETLERIATKLEFAIQAYNSTITAVHEGRAPVEQAFEKVRELRWALMFDDAEDDISALERMSDIERAQLALRVPGVRIWYHESQGVTFDPAFFLDLAQRHGTDADKQFFSNYRRTFPGGYDWPVYIQQQTDVTGCTDYGPGNLVMVYGMWHAFVQRFPTQYIDAAREQLDEVSRALASDRCACGDAQSAIRELSQFVATFPNHGLTPQVSQQLNAVTKGKSGMRFNCLSG